MKRIKMIVLIEVLALLAVGCANSARDRAGSDRGAVHPDNAPVVSSLPLKQHEFAVLSFRALRDEFGNISVVGEVKNTGTAPRGVELQATLRDGAGRLVAVGQFCPAAHEDIRPEETRPFGYSFGRQENVARAELRIVGAFRTIDMFGFASVPQ